MLKKGCQAQAHLVFSCLAHVTVSKLIMWQAFCHIDERVEGGLEKACHVSSHLLVTFGTLLVVAS